MEREVVSPFHVDGYQQKTTPTQEKNENTNQGFVQLVLGPILKCIGLFGFPVPDDCPHVKTGSTADTSTCSSCSSVQNQDSLRHVHTEDTLLQDLDTPPQDYKDDALISDPADATRKTTCMTSGRSDKNIVPVWTISEQDLKQDIQEQMNEDCQAVMQNKSTELKGKHAVYPVPHSVEKNTFISDGETNIYVRHRHHRADVEKISELKEQELRMRRQQCRHQMLCAILHHFQGCLPHITSLAFVSGIPLFCLIIFGLGNSSLQADEAGLVGFTLVHTTMALATPTVLGILVNDHAHGVQEVMYATDWSQFSDRLLTKVLGTLVTYTIVVIQFQQGDVSTGHTASNTTVLS
ncbi:hypothetical protein ACOMHN_025607 [Nucella lapillus]